MGDSREECEERREEEVGKTKTKERKGEKALRKVKRSLVRRKGRERTLTR